MEADNDCGYTDINIKLQKKPTKINSNEKFGRISGKYESNLTLRCRQIVAATGPFFSTLSAGMTSGFSAVLLPQLMKDDSTITITDVQASWIASIAVLPMAVGCIISGISMEKIGRRLTQRIANVLFIIGWILLSLSNDFKMLLFGRLMTGLCVGLFSPLCLVYIAETSDPLIRGTMLAFIPLGISSGILISHLLGTLLHWKIAASLCGLFPLTASIVLLFAPESPSWLILKGFTKEGERAFRQLRGYSTESSSELKSMLQKKNSMTDDILKSNKHNILKQVVSPTFLKPLFTMLTFFFIQQFSGINAVIFYSVNILSTISNSVNEYLATIIIDCVRVLMSAITCVLLKKFKRRTLAIFSSIATGVALLGFAISYKLLSKEYSWASLPFIIAYICFVNIGIVPLPWILTGEVFPRNLREVGSGCCTCFGFLMFFTVVKMSPFLFATFGPGNIFLMFALIALIGSIFIYCFLPETKNMTLESIENELTNKEFSLERSNVNL